MSKPKTCPFALETIRRDYEWSCIAQGGIYMCETQNPENYVKCRLYAEAYLLRTLPLPHQCPLLFDCHKEIDHTSQHPGPQHEKDCPCGGIDPLRLALDLENDYRTCDTFSKWFWQKRTEK